MAPAGPAAAACKIEFAGVIMSHKYIYALVFFCWSTLGLSGIVVVYGEVAFSGNGVFIAIRSMSAAFAGPASVRQC